MTIPEEMQAWVLSGFGDRANLAFTTCPTPMPAPGEVLVEVCAAGMNFADGLMIAGRYQLRPTPPFVLGAELTGRVVAAGPDSAFRPGDRVAAQVWSGAYGQYCAVEEGRLIRLPDAISFAEGAALPVSYTTAHIALFHEGGLTAGKTVLIHAAAGGIGVAATQLAKAAGARVLATASSDDKLKIAEANGADVLINYRREGWMDEIRRVCPDGVDLVVDPVGGQTTLDSLRCLAWRGRILLIGFASGGPAQIPANRLLVNAAAAVGIYWNYEKDGPLVTAVQAELAARLAAGELRPRIGARYPVADFLTALDALEGGRTTGKVVLDF